MARKQRTRQANPTEAVLYCRVSTEEQATEGVSLDAQQAALRAYCAMRGLRVVGLVIDPGVSAGKPLSTREGGARVQALVREGKVGAVVALKLDRLCRDASDCLAVTQTWDRRGVALHLVDLGGQAVDTSTAMGRFFLTVMAGCAELERNQIRERTSAAMRHKATRGEFIGGRVPYGFQVADDGVRLEEVEPEQQVVREAQKLRSSGLSLRAVSAELDRLGFASRSGGRFAAEQVRRMLAAA